MLYIPIVLQAIHEPVQQKVVHHLKHVSYHLKAFYIAVCGICRRITLQFYNTGLKPNIMHRYNE